MTISRFKALALFSGGLDSILSIKIIQLQGIIVEAISYHSPFFNNRALQEIADKLNVKYHKIDITDEMIKIIEKPEYGFGKNLNPCIDCHIFMIEKAGKLLKKYKADFIITGEVVGERPKSQNYKALNIIANRSGCKDYLLRPLSAKKLPITEVEKKGIVDREKLYGITGKSRKPQITLAEKFNIDYFPQPAGGCLLTVPRFSDRLRISLRLNKTTKDHLELLKHGRHFLTKGNIKIIIGRDEEDNQNILRSTDNKYFIFELVDLPGPVGLLCEIDPEIEDIIATASLIARYSKLRDEKFVEIKYYKRSDKIKVNPKSSKELKLTHI